ncbi:MAG: ABC transporter permease [Flavobacteriales bacterium]
MNKIGLVLRRDYLARVRKRTFLIMTLVMPLLLLGMATLIYFMFQYNIADSKPLAVYDESGMFQEAIQRAGFHHVVFVPTDGLAVAKDRIRTGDRYMGLLYIPSKGAFDADYTQAHIELFSVKPVSTWVTDQLENTFDNFFTNYKLQRLGVPQRRIKAAKTQVKIRLKNFKNQDTRRISALAAPISYAFIFLMYFFVFVYGVRVMRSVLEEKLNRVVEVVISAVKPVQLMLGKIFASVLVGLTQFAIWILLIGGAFLLFGAVFSTGLSQAYPIAGLAEMNIPLLLFAFIFYFAFGVLTYNSIFAAIGSAVDNQTDTQQFLLVVSIPIAIAMYGSFSIAQNPDGAVGFWLSVIPLTSPIAMMARIPFGVPLWQLALSMLLLVGFFFFMVWIAARIYKVGILMYGKKPNWKELYKWLKY